MSMVSAFAIDIGDPDSTRTVWAVVALLAVMGIALVMVAFWLRRTTRPDPDFLAPLELMGERSWRRGDPVWQRRRLDEVRPEGAAPLRRTTAPPRIDEAFDDGPSGAGFDDLHDSLHNDAPATPPVADQPEHTGDDATGDEPDNGAPGVGQADGDAEFGADGETLPAAGENVDRTHTPIGASRPYLDDLPDHEIDPEELRQAMAELDAELHRNADD